MMHPGNAPMGGERRRDDSYGSKFRNMLMKSMEEPAKSTQEKFEALNRRRKEDRVIEEASKYVWRATWILLALVVIAQFYIYYRRHHG